MLRATLVTHGDGMELAALAETADPTADFAGSLPWLRAAGQALGVDAIVHVALHDAVGGALCGHIALQRTRADWRTGSPGRATLVWPMADVGFGFRPRWFGEPRPMAWLPALRALFREERIELRRCDPICAPDETPATFERSDGIGTWVLPQPGVTEAWLASLQGKHRRDLAKYRRDIQKAGGEWIDTTSADATLLDACFQLHRARLQDKGKRSAYFAAPVEQFLRALASATAGAGLRLSLLRREGRFAAACLSFVHRGRYKAFVSGWDRAHARLDLGRQVLYHQLLAELPAGLAEIDFLGGDLDYKREFGLRKAATVDLVGHGNGLAKLRARVVAGAIEAYRNTRARLLTGGR
jgi:CelD/BcsL family acetyltransferase involved in cellulose biosynthesis